jgi:ABC-type lipoprotein release transport system permease subunit
MNTYIWLIRSLRFHRRMHLALAGGAALATAVLAAALLTGDALNRNLRRIALERVGGIRSAVELRGRFVDASLADRLATATGAQVAPVLRLSASVLAIDDHGAETQVPRVNAFGVDARFFTLGENMAKSRGRDRAPTKLSSFGNVGAPPRGAMMLSRRVMDALGRVNPDASLSLRFEQPSAFPIEMPLGDRRGDRALRRPVQLRGVLPDAALGRFALTANQIPPLNAFVNRAWLAGEAGVSNRVNLLLSDAEPANLEAALRKALLPSDVGVNVVTSTGGVGLAQSDRIYLDEAYTQALSTGTNAPVLALHHLVDAFAAGGAAVSLSNGSRGRSPSSSNTNREDTVRETPYGFITAESPTADARLGVVPAGMEDDEIVINAWLAEKLRLAVGDPLTLRWRRFESDGKLVPDTATFRVAHVIDMAACAPERAMLPRFPGLSDVDRCADWDVGMPLDKEKLNDPDNEAYWKAYGPTPKAFVTLAAGRLMLGTHFGSAMTARFAPEFDRATIMAALRQADPKDLGLGVRPLRQEALQSVGQAMDFRQLFVGMALVLMVSALILTGLLASLGVAHRRAEVGVLRAAGFTPRQVSLLWLAESLPPLLAGVAAGVVTGMGGARLLIWALNRFWSGAVASAQVPFTVGLEACAMAGAAALAMSLLAVRWGVRRALRVQVRELLGDQPEEENCETGGRWTVWNFAVGMGAAAVAIALLAFSGRAFGEAASGIFFGAGLLLMVSLLCFARLLVQFLDSAPGPGRAGATVARAECGEQRRTARSDPSAKTRVRGTIATGPVRAGVLNVARHRGRSLLVMTLLATGCFLTIGTLSMKQDPAANLTRTWSGSGGFGAMVELSIPLPGDKGDEAVRQALEAGSVVLPFRVQEGDEAGCLNLNHAVQPRLLGVSPDAAAAVSAFERSRSEIAEGSEGDSIWSLLQHPMPDDTIPVLAGDLTTVEYGLQAKAGVRDGSVYEYAGEDGTVWRLRVVGALPVRTGVLQGSLLVDESVFTRMYPSAPGHGLWLVRSGLSEADVATRLRRALGRNGGMVTPTRERLRLLGAVESTYLDMFLVLGGLGVVLGAAGVGLVVLRNAASRRGELAVLRAVGVPPRKVLLYLMMEHVYVLLAGLLAGIVPALVAVQPAMRNLGQEMPVGAMAAIIAAMVVAGLLGTLAAVRTAARFPLIEALRGE